MGFLCGKAFAIKVHYFAWTLDSFLINLSSSKVHWLLDISGDNTLKYRSRHYLDERVSKIWAQLGQLWVPLRATNSKSFLSSAKDQRIFFFLDLLRKIFSHSILNITYKSEFYIIFKNAYLYVYLVAYISKIKGFSRRTSTLENASFRLRTTLIW